MEVLSLCNSGLESVQFSSDDKLELIQSGFIIYGKGYSIKHILPF